MRLEGVSKSFGSTSVLIDVSLQVSDGELVAVLGPSGSGKSTVLRLIAGLDDPTSGGIFIGERQVNALPPRERDVAFVFQSYALYPHLTVFDNIAFPLKVAGVDRALIRERVEAVASFLELKNLLGRLPRELSGGQRQRVAIGRAAVRQPSVFLFDEPLSNLDARLRAATRLELVALHRRLKTTALYVTHDQEEAMTIGQRIAVVHEGRLQQMSTPREIYDRPRNLFVASFIGSPRMNLLGGWLENSRFHTAAGVLDLAPSTVQSGDLTLGIRPDQLSLTGDDGLRGEVEVVEDLGREQHVHVRVGSERLTIVHRGEETARLGERVSVAFDREAVHWFSTANGQNLVDSR